MVFDLQRFALHDGPGIRTTIFLKGCPLDCKWCHNPESKKMTRQIGLMVQRCTGCGNCQNVCPHGVHTITKAGEHKVDYAKCCQCGKCVDSCLNQAIKMYGHKRKTEDLLDVVVKDRDFYERSGGGLTVSGGEPMMQFQNLKELLQGAKQRKLHVCLDTSGQADTEKYLEIAPYVDIFLYDYKITDPRLHREYVGRDNRTIIDNLDALCRNGSNIYLRCPIIPGVNDNREHYKAIAHLSQKYEQIRQVNLMTYHNMAMGKAEQIGDKYELAELKTIEEAQRQQIYDEVEACGCLRLKKG